MAWIANPEIWIGLAILTALEIELGIDNLIFISILAGKLPENQQRRENLTALPDTIETIRGNERISWAFIKGFIASALPITSGSGCQKMADQRVGTGKRLLIKIRKNMSCNVLRTFSSFLIAKQEVKHLSTER
jgi:hypothetical protein